MKAMLLHPEMDVADVTDDASDASNEACKG